VSVYVRMRVGGSEFALSVAHVREIARLGEIAPVPGAGEAVLGVRNLRGQVLPVFDLAALLEVAEAGHRERIVVAEEGGHRVGFAIDAVTDVAELDDDDVRVIDVPGLFDAIQERAIA
jgi:chemotaxis signal transduction protein